MWGYEKNELYKIPVTTREDMQTRIRADFQIIITSMTRNVNHLKNGYNTL